QGEVAELRLYRRALSEGELQALIQPGKQFLKRPPPEKTRDLTLKLGTRQMIGELQQPAFVVVRLDAGPLRLQAKHSEITDLDRIVFTPLADTNEVSKHFREFEKRSPKLGVHLGLRRDCGSTFAQVGSTQTVASDKLTRYVYEGAIR